MLEGLATWIEDQEQKPPRQTRDVDVQVSALFARFLAQSFGLHVSCVFLPCSDLQN